MSELSSKEKQDYFEVLLALSGFGNIETNQKDENCPEIVPTEKKERKNWLFGRL